MKLILFILIIIFNNLSAEPFAFSNFYIQSDKITVRPGDKVFLEANFNINENVAYKLTWSDDVKSKFIFDTVHKAIWIAPNERTKTKIKAVLEDFYGNQLSDEINITVEWGHVPVANDDINVALFGEDNQIARNYSGVFLSSVLLSNDTDSDGDILKVIDVKAKFGDEDSFKISDDKTKVQFIPHRYFDHLPVGATQRANFTYTISDGHGNTDKADAYLTVFGIDDEPEVNDDEMTIRLPALSVSTNILLNDNDIDDNSSFEVKQISTDVIPIDSNISKLGSYGMFVFSRDGNVSYKPFQTNPDILAMSSSDKLYDTISNIYVQEKYSSVVKAQNLVVTLLGQNDAPIAVDDNEANITKITVVDDFENNASGWSDQNITNNIELTKFLGRFSGSNGDQDIYKIYSFGIENAYTNVLIEFDFYEIDSWDNEQFKVFVNNSIVYEKKYIYGLNYNENSGTFTSSNLFEGYGKENIHRYSFLATTDNFGNLKLGFGSTLNQSITDESYGIDNIKLSTIPLSSNKSLNIKVPTSLLLKNDSDPDGDEITVSSVGSLNDENNISIATSSIDSSGKFISFIPNESLVSSMSNNIHFEYFIKDSNGAEANATVILKLYTQDLELVDDYYSIYENKTTPLINNLFDNDINNNGTTLIVTNANNNIIGSYGNLNISSNGDYSYTLDPLKINIRHKDILREIFTIDVQEQETGLNKTQNITIDINGIIKAVDDNISNSYGEYTTITLDEIDILNNDDYRFGFLDKVEVDTKAYIKGTSTISGDVVYSPLSKKITYTPSGALAKMALGETRTLSINYEIFGKINNANIIDGVTSLSDSAVIDLNISSAIVFYRCPQNVTNYDISTDSCIQKIGTDFTNLNNWTSTTTAPTDGNWTVSADGNSVYQSVNTDHESSFIAPNNFNYLSFEGKMKVVAGSDDDFIGFVFGYNNGKYILFDWKKSTQSGARGIANEGFTLSKVNSNNNLQNNWGHDGDTVLLKQNIGAGKGWVHGTDYTIRLSYTINKVKVEVNGATVMDYSVHDNLTVNKLPIGKIGFYNFSQGHVDYRNFKIVPYDCEANGYVTSDDKQMCISQ